ncbi:MAG: hypothetical protein COT36_03640 [Parcubacteria group bacterium CG08_land_8_20_14_0_20_38_56]|nr:MAG: hypothetical protein COT36_03640 [Parcubacteria group bacterium CG08_land_8_20_14_0_20_38_56]
MPQKGTIDLAKVKASYEIEDISLVDSNKLGSANECRLYFEIFFSIGVALIGNIVSKFNITFLVVSLLFISLGIFFLIRYILKFKGLKKTKKPEEGIPVFLESWQTASKERKENISKD